MRRFILLSVTLSLVAARPLLAGTFEHARIAPDLGLDALTRGVAHEQVGRDVFADPYATVTLGNVDVYDVFPYVESRTFQVVSDPRWNRLVYGEPGRDLFAFDGAGTSLGVLRGPSGLAVDEANHVYVADTDNDRIVVLKASTEFGAMRLIPEYAIPGLSRPHGVAYSDGGTPFSPGDDVLYVADTGRNRIVAFGLAPDGARQVAALGDLGNGPGRFAGPMAVAVGRANGATTPDVYVADAHTRRIVHLRLAGGTLQWLGAVQHDADVVTSLETDQWGNLYAAAPNRGLVRKFTPDLVAVADLRSDLARPRAFHLPFVSVRDHRDGTATRVGQPNGLSVDQWTDASGLRLWSLGVDVNRLAVAGGDAPTASFTLTDQAAVSLEIVDGPTGRLLSHRDAGALGAGEHQLALVDADLQAAAGSTQPLLRLRAASSYPGGASTFAQAPLGAGGAMLAPAHPMLMGNQPNPVTGATRIVFALPTRGADQASLRLFDAAGRLVRGFGQSFTPGRNEVAWDGTDERGRPVAGGVYFYRLTVDRKEFSRRMVVVR